MEVRLPLRISHNGLVIIITETFSSHPRVRRCAGVTPEPSHYQSLFTSQAKPHLSGGGHFARGLDPQFHVLHIPLFVIHLQLRKWSARVWFLQSRTADCASDSPQPKKAEAMVWVSEFDRSPTRCSMQVLPSFSPSAADEFVRRFISSLSSSPLLDEIFLRFQ